jgi:hypothetical protein
LDNDFSSIASNLYKPMRSNNMASERAAYWMAVGVMALVLGNHFVDRYDGRCLADRSLATVQRVFGQASHCMAMAKVVLGRTSLPLVRTETEVAGIQTRFASVDTVMARQQTARARAEQARRVAFQQLQQIHLEVLCPRQTLKLSIPRPPLAPEDGTI